MSDSDKINIARTVTGDQPRPATANPASLEDVVDYLVIRVDRLNQSAKLLRWVAVTAITFALAAIITVARMLYGLGADDASLKLSIERAQRQADENKEDIKELARYIYSRRSGYLTQPPSMIDGKDGQ